MVLHLVWVPWPAEVPQTRGWWLLCWWFPWGFPQTLVRCQYGWWKSLLQLSHPDQQSESERQQPWTCWCQGTQSESTQLHQHQKLQGKNKTIGICTLIFYKLIFHTPVSILVKKTSRYQHHPSEHLLWPGTYSCTLKLFMLQTIPSKSSYEHVFFYYKAKICVKVMLNSCQPLCQQGKYFCIISFHTESQAWK